MSVIFYHTKCSRKIVLFQTTSFIFLTFSTCSAGFDRDAVRNAGIEYLKYLEDNSKAVPKDEIIQVEIYDGDYAFVMIKPNITYKLKLNDTPNGTSFELIEDNNHEAETQKDSLMYRDPENPQEFLAEEDIQNVYHPIIFFMHNDRKKAYVLGGSKDGAWISPIEAEIESLDGEVIDMNNPMLSNGPRKVKTELIKGNEQFVIFSDHYEKTLSGEGGELEFWVSQASGQLELSFPFTPFESAGTFLIGYHGCWDALPRIPKRINNRKYELDFDNNGINEAITVEYTDLSPTYCSIVVHAIAINNSTLIANIDTGKELSETFKIFTLDLNGDGKMEIITAFSGPAGYVAIDEMQDDGSFKQVLGFDSGE